MNHLTINGQALAHPDAAVARPRSQAPRRQWWSEIREAVGLALDALLRNRLRSFLTVLGIIIGVSTVITISSVVNGLNTNVISSVESWGSNIIIVFRFPWASLGRPPSEWFSRKHLEPEWADEIAQIPGVAAAAPSMRIFRPEFGAGTSYVRRGEVWAKNVILQGNPASIQNVMNVQMTRGRWFTNTDTERANPVAVLGFDTAKTLFPNPTEDPIGKEILIEGKVFYVVGVLDREKQAFGAGNNPEDNIAIMPLGTLRKMHPEAREYVFFIKAESADLVAPVMESTRDLLRRKRKVPSNKPDDFAIFTPDVFIELWKQISGGIFIVMFAVGSVGLMVGGIGVMNIMLVSVTERTREIGIRKAIGAKRRNIMWQFLVEATTLAFIGGLLGVVIGSALGLSVRFVFPSLPTTVSMFWIILGLTVACGIGIVFGIYPAWKAARLDPVEALRYE